MPATVKRPPTIFVPLVSAGAASEGESFFASPSFVSVFTSPGASSDESTVAVSPFDESCATPESGLASLPVLAPQPKRARTNVHEREREKVFIKVLRRGDA